MAETFLKLKKALDTKKQTTTTKQGGRGRRQKTRWLPLCTVVNSANQLCAAEHHVGKGVLSQLTNAAVKFMAGFSGHCLVTRTKVTPPLPI